MIEYNPIEDIEFLEGNLADMSDYPEMKIDLDMAVNRLKEHFKKELDSNLPLKFKELKAGMWIWDNKNKCWLFLFKPLDWKPIKGLRYADHIIDHSADGYYMDFEAKRFYRRQVEE